MTAGSQALIDFLSTLAQEARAGRAKAPMDHAELVRLARERGIATDEAGIRRTFALIMRARLLRASRP